MDSENTKPPTRAMNHSEYYFSSGSVRVRLRNLKMKVKLEYPTRGQRDKSGTTNELAPPAPPWHGIISTIERRDNHAVP